MTHSTISYSSLLIIVLLAAFVPVIMKKMKWLPIPIVVGEVIAGMIVGKSGFNLIEETAWLNFLYTFGFAFLMFLSGLEIYFHLIRSTRSQSTTAWYKNPSCLHFFIFRNTITWCYHRLYFKRISINYQYSFNHLNLKYYIPWNRSTYFKGKAVLKYGIWPNN